MLLKLTLLLPSGLGYLEVCEVIPDLIRRLIGQGGFMYSRDLIHLAPHVTFDEFDFNFQDDCGFSCHLTLCSCQVFD